MTSRPKALVLNGLLLVGALVVTLGVIEIVLRMAQPAAAGGGEIQVSNEYDPTLGWRKVPGTTDTLATAEYRIVEHINSHGIRGPEVAEAKPVGTHRILILGDSYAEGYTVDFEDLCSEVLSRALRAAPGGPFEVINAGTAGYSTDQELLYFVTRGWRFRPDVTVLLFYVNDVWYNARSRYWRGHKPLFTITDGALTLTNVPVPEPDPSEFAFEVAGGTGITRLIRRADAWLGSHTALYRVSREGVRNAPLLHSALIRLGFAEVPGEFRPWSRVRDPELERAWSITESLLQALGDSAAAAGSRLVVFHVPPRPAVYPDDWERTRRTYGMSDADWSPREDEQVLRAICARRGLDCIFPTERFVAEAARMAPGGRRLYFAHDAHWTVDGHRLAGELLAEHLRPPAGH